MAITKSPERAAEPMSTPEQADAIRRLHAQFETARALAESSSLSEAAPRILRALGEILRCDHGAVWSVDPAGSSIRCLETWHPPSASLPEFDAATRAAAFAPGIGLPGRVWQSGRPAWIEDVTRDANFPRAPVAARAGLHGAFGFPIVLGGSVLGMLEFFSREIREPDPDLLELLATIGSQIGQFVERKRAEGELGTFFAMSRDMLCIASFDGYFRRLNPAWQETLGYSLAELTSRPYVDFVHPDDRGATAAEAKSVSAGQPMLVFENRYRRKDGSYRWLAWKSAARVEQGLVYCVARDVTEQKRKAEELRQARRAAEAASRAKSDFLANVSHEIRTPMNAVIGMAELLLDTQLRRVQREYLLALKDAAESLLGLINDLLDFARIEAGKLELQPAAFDLRELLGDTLLTLGVRAHQKGLELASRVAPEVPGQLVGDPARLRQVIVNLVGNAIKFTARGEVLVEVAPARRDARGVVLGFTVSDTGIGIAPEKQRLVFEAFAQADGSTTREHGGTGLGLAIASRIVGAMGGRLELESTPGRGSRFRFEVRFGRGTGAAAREPKTATIRGVRVLVVDDNATNRRILAETLLHWRMRPTLAGGGREALSALERAQERGRPFPLALVDANMPGLDGFALAERMRKRRGLFRTRVLMLTSGPRPGDERRARALGVASYLIKPVKQSDLLDRIVEALVKPARAAARTRGRAPAAGRRLRVLVAEDNVVNQQVAVGMLERAGHRAVVVENGRQALAAVAREPFDLVLMDVQMPELDGLEATAAIRERERASGKHLPIVALTAHAMKGDAERCLAAGMDAYLAKPLAAEELVATISRLVPDATIDRARLLERVGGDARSLAEVARIFLADAPKRLAEIRQAIARGDPAALRGAAHTLKGAVSNFGARAAADAAFELQKLGDAGNLAEAQRVLERLETEMKAVRAELRELARGRRTARASPSLAAPRLRERARARRARPRRRRLR
jgi:PAS domain S-box-containing protein